MFNGKTHLFDVSFATAIAAIAAMLPIEPKGKTCQEKHAIPGQICQASSEPRDSEDWWAPALPVVPNPCCQAQPGNITIWPPWVSPDGDDYEDMDEDEDEDGDGDGDDDDDVEGLQNLQSDNRT